MNDDAPIPANAPVIDTRHKARAVVEVLAAKGVTIEVTPEGVKLMHAAGKLGPRDVRWLKRERDNLRRHLTEVIAEPEPEAATLNPWRCPKCASPELVYREDHARNLLHRCGRCGLTWHWGDPSRLVR
ncbi:MAG: hypothetical protein ACRCT8_03265 [Lacipirellulaceae bacterium]